MKNLWKPTIAAFAIFAFTACGSNEDATTEAETIETEEMEMDSEMDMGTELEEDTTIVVEDTTVNDGVADEIEEEQPPIE